MAQGLKRATFNRSSLVSVLSDTLTEIPDPKYDFGERIGTWLDFSDALTLFSVLGTQAGRVTPAGSAATDLPAQLARVRRDLSDSIHNDGVFKHEPAPNPFLMPLPKGTSSSAADFSPYHRAYLAHQRDMSAAIAALRANARKALSSQSAAGRQLADLDAAFEKFLINRERNLLATIPLMLGTHFDLCYAKYHAALADGSAEDPGTWAKAGGGLDAFHQKVQSVLLAEMELRLKPVAALIAALCSASETNETIETNPQ
jgi:hypothetical protein